MFSGWHKSEFAILFHLAFSWYINGGGNLILWMEGGGARLYFGANNAAKMHIKALYVCRHASWWRGEIIFIIFECISLCSRPTQNAALNKAHFPLILHIHRLAQWSVQFATLECLKEQIESFNKKLALAKILRPQLSFPLVTHFQTALFEGFRTARELLPALPFEEIHY